MTKKMTLAFLALATFCGIVFYLYIQGSCHYGLQDLSVFEAPSGTYKIEVKTGIAGPATGSAFQRVFVSKVGAKCGVAVADIYADEVLSPVRVEWRSATEADIYLRERVEFKQTGANSAVLVNIHNRPE